MCRLANQVFKSRYDAAFFHAGQAGLDRFIGPKPEKQGVMHCFQFMGLDIAPDFTIEFEVYASAFENFLPQAHDLQFEFEVRNAESSASRRFPGSDRIPSR